MGSFKRKLNRAKANHLKLVETPKSPAEKAPIIQDKNGLSVAVLVRKKNGAVRTLVESLKNIVNEILLIDIASGEQTKKIASDMHVNYVEALTLRQGYEIGMRRASYSTVLFLFEEESIVNPIYLTNLHLTDLDVASVYLSYEGEQPFELEPSIQIRLFKKKLPVTWNSDFFGSVWDSLIEMDANLGITKLTVSTPSTTSSESMIRKENTELRKALKETNNLYTSYELASNLSYLRQYDQSIEYLELLLKKWDDSNPYHSHVVKLLLQAYLHTNQLEKAESLLDEALPMYSLYTDLLYISAKLFVAKGDIDKAKEYILQLEKASETPGMYFREKNIKDKARQLLEEVKV